MQHKVLVATTTFSTFSREPIEVLLRNGIDIVQNECGQKLSNDQLKELAVGCSGVLAGIEEYSSKILHLLPELKVISRLGVGMDNIDLKATKEIGIQVFKTETTPAPAVAELVLGIMIDVSRYISKCDQSLKNGTWKKRMGFLLQGKTLGIIGLGTIGKELVKLASGFCFNILAFDQQEDELFAKENAVTYYNLETLLKKSDIVSIHLNLSDQTKHLIDKEKFKLMKPEAILINTSRGKIIHETALNDALINKQIAGAGLDVFENEPYTGSLTKLDNVVLTPHIGAYAREVRIKMEMEAVENLISGLNEV